jgi:hypothetical protein
MPFLNIAEVPPPWYIGISALIGRGSIIEPGNWGRVQELKKDWTSLDNYRWLCEDTFDRVRSGLTPRPPSRLNSVFVCPTLGDAHRFCGGQSGRTDVLYEVEPTKATKRVFVTSWQLFSFGPETWPPPLVQWRQQAIRYWTETPVNGREVLLSQAVRIVRRL